jgi:hypothetical protein
MSRKDWMDWIVFIGCLLCSCLSVCIAMLVYLDLLGREDTYQVCYASSGSSWMNNCQILIIGSLLTIFSCIIVSSVHCFGKLRVWHWIECIFFACVAILWMTVGILTHNELGMQKPFENSVKNSKLWVRGLIWTISSILFLCFLSSIIVLKKFPFNKEKENENSNQSPKAKVPIEHLEILEAA